MKIGATLFFPKEEEKVIGPRSLFLALISAVGFCLGVSTETAASEPEPGLTSGIPRKIFSAQFTPDYPIWLAADSVLTPTGEVNQELEEAVALKIEKLLKRPQESGCVRWSSSKSSEETPPNRKDLRTAARSAENIVVASIVEAQPGFLNGTAGTLLRVQIADVLKGSPPDYDRFVFFPIGEFMVGEVRICKDNPLYSALPEVGDQLLVLFRTSWNSGEEILFPEGPSGLITMRQSGTVHLPMAYTISDPALGSLSRQRFLEEIQALALERDR